MTRNLSLWAALFFILSSHHLCAGELRELAQEYTAARTRIRGGKPDQRLEKARKELGPILMKIAELDSPEALAFLRNEFEKGPAEISVSSVAPILAISSDKALEVVLVSFQRRSVAVKREILQQLAKTKRDISVIEPVLGSILRGERQNEVKREIPAILARIDSLSAAKTLLSSLASGGRGRGGKEMEQAADYQRRVVSALKGMKDPGVKEWLTGDAYRGASPATIEVLARLAAEKKWKEARPELEKLLESSNETAAVAALEAIEKIGSGPSADKILKGLKKGRRSLSFRIQALDALAAAGTDECLQVVMEAARDADPETRSIALGSLAHAPSSNTAVFPSVRTAAIRGLYRMRVKPMVPALIEAMGQETQERLKIDILKLLITLTGKNMGLAIEDWRKWWEIARPKFEFVKGGAKGQRVTMGKAYDLNYFGIEVLSKRLDFVVDISGSMREQMDVYILTDEEKRKQMSGLTQSVPSKEEIERRKKKGKKTKMQKIAVLRKELARVITALSADTMINIIPFDANYKPWQKKLQPLAGAGRGRALRFVAGLQNGSGTNVFDSLEFALKDRNVDTIFLLTDGKPTRGRITDTGAIIREVNLLNRVRGVTINCIGFGGDKNALKFLEDLARENGGEYRFVDSY